MNTIQWVINHKMFFFQVIQMLSLSFVEVYPRPPLLSNATIDSICSEDRRFLVDFEDDRILKEMFGEDK